MREGKRVKDKESGERRRVWLARGKVCVREGEESKRVEESGENEGERKREFGEEGRVRERREVWKSRERERKCMWERECGKER